MVGDLEETFCGTASDISKEVAISTFFSIPGTGNLQVHHVTKSDTVAVGKSTRASKCNSHSRPDTRSANQFDGQIGLGKSVSDVTFIPIKTQQTFKINHIFIIRRLNNPIKIFSSHTWMQLHVKKAT